MSGTGDSDVPKWPAPALGKIPDSFHRYHEKLREILGYASHGTDASRPHLLRPSIHQLAVLGEESREFEQLVSDLLPDPDDIDEVEHFPFGWGTFESYEAPVSYSPSVVLRSLLRRSGYYHAVLAGEAPELFWQRIVDRIQYSERKLPCFWLLAGWSFPRDRFELAGLQVVRMTPDELASLGPSPAVCEEFCPGEMIPAEFAENWFLKRIGGVISGYAGGKKWLEREPGPDPEREAESARIFAEADKIIADLGLPTEDPEPEPSPNTPTDGSLKILRQAEVAANKTIVIERSPAPPLSDYEMAVPLLILTLYHHKFFDVPCAFLSDPGWRITWAKRAQVRRTDYEVKKEQWFNFVKFTKIAQDGIERLKPAWSPPRRSRRKNPSVEEQYQRKFQVAAGRYLNATFVSGHTFFPSLELDRLKLDEESVFEETLLQYAFALEAALLEYTDRKKSDTLAARASLLIGRNPGEQKRISDFVLEAYRARNKIVHGEQLETRDLHLRALRVICQRVLAAIICLPVDRDSSVWTILKELSHDGPLNREARKRAREAQKSLFRLIPDSYLWTKSRFD